MNVDWVLDTRPLATTKHSEEQKAWQRQLGRAGTEVQYNKHLCVITEVLMKACSWGHLTLEMVGEFWGRLLGRGLYPPSMRDELARKSWRIGGHRPQRLLA